MVNQSNKTLNSDITKLVNQPYKYGFSTNIERENFEKGLNEEIIRLISKKKDEPEFLLAFRLKAYRKWKEMKCPEWAQLKFSENNYQQWHGHTQNAPSAHFRTVSPCSNGQPTRRSRIRPRSALCEHHC